MEQAKKMLREIVQALLALILVGAVVYMSVRGTMPSEILAGLAGMSVGFFVAERKNGEERLHQERMEQMRVGGPREPH